jgi:hypothetical protein
MIYSPLLGEFAFDGRFEDRGFVALQIDLQSIEVCERFIQARELLFDFSYDSDLFIERGNPDGTAS